MEGGGGEGIDEGYSGVCLGWEGEWGTGWMWRINFCAERDFE